VKDRGGLVAHDSAIICGRLVNWLRLDIGESRTSPEYRIVDALLDIGSGLADPADRYIDQARMAPTQFVGPEAEPLHGAGTKILYQHVGLGHEFGQNLAANFALDVDRQRALAPVRGD